MSKIVSEDALRRALGKIPEAEGTEWMRKHLFKSVAAACHTPWILDIDTTIKTLFGHQEGAEVGYNPHKPGRPSHAYHAYWMGNLVCCWMWKSRRATPRPPTMPNQGLTAYWTP